MSDTVNRSAGATHGKPFAPSFHETASAESSFHEATATESQGNQVAVPFLNDEIERSGLPRKQLAAKVGKTEASFSKMTTTGPNAQAFGLDAFEQLPLPIQVAWLKRYGRTLGLQVHELDPVQVATAIIERFEELQRFVQMFQIGKARMRHATLDSSSNYRGEERRKVRA